MEHTQYTTLAAAKLIVTTIYTLYLCLFSAAVSDDSKFVLFVVVVVAAFDDIFTISLTQYFPSSSAHSLLLFILFFSAFDYLKHEYRVLRVNGDLQIIPTKFSTTATVFKVVSHNLSKYIESNYFAHSDFVLYGTLFSYSSNI